MTDQMQEAAVLLFGLRSGYLVHAEVIEAIDELILRLPTPDPSLIDISLTNQESRTFEARLHRAAGEWGAKPPLRNLFESMQAVLARHPERAERVVGAIFQLSLDERLTPVVAAEARHLEYAYELASSGAAGTFVEANVELTQFLRIRTSEKE